MKFQYFDGEQRSPEWYALRLGKVTASQLWAWLAVSKAKDGAGKPLKARLDYEKELLFERRFNTSFENFVSEAMQDGIDYEDYARHQYQEVTGNSVEECGAWYNDYFCASPDGVVGEDGLLEVKIVKDNTFTEILTSGVPDKWWKQCQGQLWASGRKWCDFVAVNFNTKKIKIIRVLPDKEFHEWAELAIVEDFNTDDSIFDDSQLYDLKELPAMAEPISAGQAAEDIKELGF
jgi:predicted phage-related endonuclease